jgi:hypothetical protein
MASNDRSHSLRIVRLAGLVRRGPHAIRGLGSEETLVQTYLRRDLQIRMVGRSRARRARVVIRHTSPLSWKHINLTGIYSWDVARSSGGLQAAALAREMLLAA